jgi:DNA (cytosine-5)-methyltransferase 1
MERVDEREVLRLASDSDVRWLLLENVPFMLQLDRGEAMRYLTRSLEEIEFTWAYRVVDTRVFGLPQRRQRVNPARVAHRRSSHDPLRR